MQSYIVKHKDRKIRMESRSGGIFTAVSDVVLNQGGVVYGCRLNDDFQAVHDRAVTKEERDCFRGSKYVQSNIQDAYQRAVQDIRAGKRVLFTGTPCEIAGMQAICPEEGKEQLLTMDIVCHGVPSPKIWNDYKAYMEQKYHGKITGVDFRNKKKYGWAEHIETLTIGGKERDSKIYMKLFYSHSFLRESCYECPYKNIHHPADITIADAWGVDTADPDFDDHKGVSLVLVNTPKGEQWVNEALKSCTYRKCQMEGYLQEPLQHSFAQPEEREALWNEYRQKSFQELVEHHYKEPVMEVTKRKLRNLVKRMIPLSLRNKLRNRSV